MKPLFPLLLFLWVLGPSVTSYKISIRWCTRSLQEAKKCLSLEMKMRRVAGYSLSCIQKISSHQCIRAVVTKAADAVTLDTAMMLEAGQPLFKLRPVAAEVYGTEAPSWIHYYVVAVVRKESVFTLSQLKGRKSCHTGINTTAGWQVPLGMLRPFLNWTGSPDDTELVVSGFFNKSCIPGAKGSLFPNLCALCAGKEKNHCSLSSEELYFGDSGAFKCLRDGAGDVAFTKARAVLEALPKKADRDQYKLLCPDNTWRPVDEFKGCHLARVPTHAVMGRSHDGKEGDIWKFLSKVQEMFGKNTTSDFKLFDSIPGHKDLLFKDSTTGFVKIPPRVDVGLYMGFYFLTALQNLKLREKDVAARRVQVMWCAVGINERFKCDDWSRASNRMVTCIKSPTTEDCIGRILKGEADAMLLNESSVYVAGKCGLVPVLVENKKSIGRNYADCVNRPTEENFAVAMVRKSDANLTWKSLAGRKSCHSAMGSTIGWNIPMGLISNQTGSCEYDKFFNQSCAPGSHPASNLCTLCVGNKKGVGKCENSSREQYFSSVGAFRCLAEKAGDVAFLKDSTVLQNTNGKNPEAWAKGLNLKDFELLCLDGTRKAVTEAHSCHLARVPNAAVVSRKDKAAIVQKVLLGQQALFGRNGSKCPGMFCLFQSKIKNLLFNDNTECLAKLSKTTTYEKFLGQEYIKAIDSLNECLSTPLLDACEFLQK